MKRALIVGSAGQDGTILSEQLKRDGCLVKGIGRADFDPGGAGIRDREKIRAMIQEWQPDEIYYLAAFHHSSQDLQDENTADLFDKSLAVHVSGLIAFLDGARLARPAARIFYAASSHIFGRPAGETQDENTPLDPVCIYGITKAAGIRCCRFYRENHGLFAAAGILFNHESPYRKENFVSQKIVRGALRIARGDTGKLILGNLSARIDWGYAPDYTDAMRRILALEKPDDFVVATGESHSVQDFVEAAFGLLGLDWRAHVEESPGILTKPRKALTGNAAKLRAATGWKPSVTFEKMVEHLLQGARHES